MKITEEEYDWITIVCQNEDWEIVDDDIISIVIPDEVNGFTVAMRITEYLLDVANSAYMKKENIKEFINKLASVNTKIVDLDGEKHIQFLNLKVA